MAEAPSLPRTPSMADADGMAMAYTAKLTPEEQEEAESWEGATPRYGPLFAKGLLATIFIVVSLYITYDGYSTMTNDMFILKWLMTILSWSLTLPALYQTTLVTLTFVALARDNIVTELAQRRPPYITGMVAFGMTLLLPFLLPILIITGPCIEQANVLQGIIDDPNDFWLVLVGLIDFVQTLVLIPLGYVVIFASACPTDVFINIVVVQVFANLDDDFVRAFTEGPQGTKQEALETYCQKVEEEKKPGEP